MADYLHGIRIEEIESGTPPIETVGASVIGLVGTAATKENYYKPVIINGSRKEAVDNFGTSDAANTYSIPGALNAILDQTSATVVVINTEPTSKNNPPTPDPENPPTPDPENPPKPDPENPPKPDPETPPKPDKLMEDTPSKTNLNKAIDALLGAESVVHQTPRILIAPGISDNVDAVQKLLNVAAKLRAIVIADAPSTVISIKDINDYADKLKDLTDKDRLYLVAPSIQTLDGTGSKIEPASARVAGVIARSDSERGFWFSPSNRPISGISGTSFPISFGLGDDTSDANQLNKAGIATIIHQDGYRLWGSRTCAGDGSKWKFLSVRRTADIINDSLLRAHLWAVDRNITKTYVDEVTEGVNQFLRQLKRDQAILGGKCWANAEANTASEIEDGKISFSFEFTPPYPAEQITFQSSIVNNYLKEIFA